MEVTHYIVASWSWTKVAQRHNGGRNHVAKELDIFAVHNMLDHLCFIYDQMGLPQLAWEKGFDVKLYI
jgi:hypothetical protein